jgi:hypothetical protein
MKPNLIAGDTLTFRVSLPSYPASTWTLAYRLVPSSGSAITFTAAADGDDHLVTVAAATTAAWASGEYAWAGYVTAGLERFTVSSGRTTIKPNPASMAVADTRTHARKVLDALKAVIEGRASKDQMAYTIDGRSLQRMPVADLLAFQAEYERKVAKEELAQAGISPRHAFVRFVRA